MAMPAKLWQHLKARQSLWSGPPRGLPGERNKSFWKLHGLSLPYEMKTHKLLFEMLPEIATLVARFCGLPWHYSDTPPNTTWGFRLTFLGVSLWVLCDTPRPPPRVPHWRACKLGYATTAWQQSGVGVACPLFAFRRSGRSLRIQSECQNSANPEKYHELAGTTPFFFHLETPTQSYKKGRQRIPTLKSSQKHTHPIISRPSVLRQSVSVCLTFVGLILFRQFPPKRYVGSCFFFMLVPVLSLPAIVSQVGKSVPASFRGGSSWVQASVAQLLLLISFPWALFACRVDPGTGLLRPLGLRTGPLSWLELFGFVLLCREGREEESKQVWGGVPFVLQVERGQGLIWGRGRW